MRPIWSAVAFIALLLTSALLLFGRDDSDFVPLTFSKNSVGQRREQHIGQQGSSPERPSTVLFHVDDRDLTSPDFFLGQVCALMSLFHALLHMGEQYFIFKLGAVQPIPNGTQLPEDCGPGDAKPVVGPGGCRLQTQWTKVAIAQWLARNYRDAKNFIYIDTDAAPTFDKLNFTADQMIERFEGIYNFSIKRKPVVLSHAMAEWWTVVCQGCGIYECPNTGFLMWQNHPFAWDFLRDWWKSALADYGPFEIQGGVDTCDLFPKKFRSMKIGEQRQAVVTAIHSDKVAVVDTPFPEVAAKIRAGKEVKGYMRKRYDECACSYENVGCFFTHHSTTKNDPVGVETWITSPYCSQLDQLFGQFCSLWPAAGPLSHDAFRATVARHGFNTLMYPGLFTNGPEAAPQQEACKRHAELATTHPLYLQPSDPRFRKLERCDKGGYTGSPCTHGYQVDEANCKLRIELYFQVLRPYLTVQLVDQDPSGYT